MRCRSCLWPLCPESRQVIASQRNDEKGQNLDAYDLYLRALPHMTSVMPADARIATGFLEDALKLDPNYAAAHAFIAWCHEICFMRGGFDEADKMAGLRHAQTAIASGTDDATTLAVAAFVIALLGKNSQSGVERHRARLVAQSLVRDGIILGRDNLRFQRQLGRRDCLCQSRAAAEPIRSGGFCSSWGARARGVPGGALRLPSTRESRG